MVVLIKILVAFLAKKLISVAFVKEIILASGAFKMYFDTKYKDLSDRLSSKGVLPKLARQLGHTEKKFLLSHVIFRGKTFYTTILEDPFFIGYLVNASSAGDEFQKTQLTRTV